MKENPVNDRLAVCRLEVLLAVFYFYTAYYQLVRGLAHPMTGKTNESLLPVVNALWKLPSRLY